MTHSRILCWILTTIFTMSHSLAYAIDNGVFTIKSKYSNKLVEVTSASQSDAANVAQWDTNGHNTQKWLITRVSGNDYSIINLNSGKALEVYARSNADGANVVQYEFNGGASQLWKINDVGNGYYSFINSYSGKAMDLYNFQTSNGANISQWTYYGNDAQLWSLSKLAKVESTPWDPSLTNGAQNHWQLSGNLVTHDPTMAYENGTWWLFQTGPGIFGKWSTNGVGWNGADPIFPYGLSWWANYVPEQEGVDVWAPEIKFYNGKAWLYYAISTFGSRVSAIGLASTTSISSGNWQDDGLVINTTNSNNYNAIDPDLVVAKDGAPWLTFGSWNTGIKIMRVNPITMKPFGQLYSIATKSGGLEAPTIIYRQGYYYLFASAGVCCAGTDSTYRIIYGRSADIRGPYLDKNGVNMTAGGGSLLDGGNSRWVGPGGQDILNTDVIVRHAYDADDSGTPKLLISTLNWDSSGWPKY